MPDWNYLMIDSMRFERTQKPADVAARLRRMADELEQGKLTVVEQEVNVPENIFFTIEFEEEHNGDISDINFEIEIEIGWPVAMLEYIDEDELEEEDEEQ